MTHAALTAGNVAVVTGGASGIGLAAATRFASLGMTVCIADLGAERLAHAEDSIRPHMANGATLLSVETDVSRLEDLQRLEEIMRVRFGGTQVLMNNAGIGPLTQVFGPLEQWERIMAVNLWGVILGTQAFVPAMLQQGRPGLVINTGSKQGITTPPGNPAYNVAKAGVKVFTEALQHQLRNTPDGALTAHLLIPGFVFTGLTRSATAAKPSGAWSGEQTVDFMLQRLEAGDFYILCPDNDVDRKLDELRIEWAAGDVIENRPPLSRWHPDYAEDFRRFIENSR